MKEINNIRCVVSKLTPRSGMAWFAFCVWLALPSFALAQGESTNQAEPKDTTAEPAPRKSEKAPVRMSFEAFTINDSVKLVARVRSKVGAKYQNTPGVEVKFYKNETSHGNLIGKGVSNRNGEAIWMLPTREIPDSSITANYWATLEDNPDYEDAEETVTVTRSKMNMELTVEDSIWWVRVFVGMPDASGEVMPMPDVECKIYIKRMFGLLQVGDAQTTDESGNISMEFPHNIQGDEAGNITIVTKIAGHEVLGNVETRNSITWGIPTKVDNFYLQRELWAARANSPILLIVMVNTMLFGIWGMILFIFLEVFRINKLGRINE